MLNIQIENGIWIWMNTGSQTSWHVGLELRDPAKLYVIEKEKERDSPVQNQPNLLIHLI